MSGFPTESKILFALQDILTVLRDIDRKMDIQVKALKLKYGERLGE